VETPPSLAAESPSPPSTPAKKEPDLPAEPETPATPEKELSEEKAAEPENPADVSIEEIAVAPSHTVYTGYVSTGLEFAVSCSVAVEQDVPAYTRQNIESKSDCPKSTIMLCHENISVLKIDIHNSSRFCLFNMHLLFSSDVP